MKRTQASNKARRQSNTKGNIQNRNRVYVFKSLITDQYHQAEEYYTQAVGEDKSFNVGGKQIISVYQAGKKIR